MKTTIDITYKIGAVYRLKDPKWPMYSYDRPAYMLWNAIANGLHDKGWSEEEIKTWLQSKATRWALDGSLGEDVEKLGREYAKTVNEKWPLN